MASALKITSDVSTRVVPGSRILRGLDAVELTSISQALAAARTIEATASDRANEARDQGYRDGYERGLAQGKADAAVAVMHLVCKEITLRDLLTPRIEQMIRSCLEGFLGERLGESSNFKSHFQQLLSHVDSNLLRRIIVSEARVPEVEQVLTSCLSPAVASNISVVVSGDLAAHELVVEAKTFVIDARLDSHFESAMEAFRNQLSSKAALESVECEIPASKTEKR